MDIGSRLRTAREAAGLSLALLSQRTRVQPRIIAAIEHNDLAGIPPKPFGRAFIRSYAREVGLDPDETVREYFQQFAPAHPPPPPVVSETTGPWVPQGMMAALAALLLVGMLVVVALTRGGSGEGTIPDERPSATAGTAAPAPAPSEPASTKTAADPPVGTTGAPTPPDTITIVLAAQDRCWVTAVADGRRVLYELLERGERREIAEARDVTVRAGNAGALLVTVNGGATGIFGASGEVRTARFTADALPALLPVGEPGPAR